MELLDLPISIEENMKGRQSWVVSTDSLPNGSANVTSCHSSNSSRRNSTNDDFRRDSFDKKQTRPCFAVAQIENCANSISNVQATIEDRHIHLW